MEKMKMNKIEDLKPEDGIVLVYVQLKSSIEFFAVLEITDDGYLTDSEDFNETAEMIGAVGWLPIPRPE